MLSDTSTHEDPVVASINAIDIKEEVMDDFEAFTSPKQHQALTKGQLNMTGKK